ncbi:hypothetical protein ACLEAR_23220, partial [Escherichia coli]
MVCVVGRMRDLILQLSKSSIYSTKPLAWRKFGSGKAVEDIVTLFTQRRPEISGFLEIFGNPRS